MAIGFGAYRIHEHSPIHEEALKFALEKGCPLIDTSANYTDGSSERLIGKTLQPIPLSQRPIIVTKAGYLQGSNLLYAQEKKDSPYPEVCKVSLDLWHCIHPEFLKDQITHSLKRLNLNVLDVFLLHNPEYFFRDFATQKEFSNPRSEYLRRLNQAFSYLEEEIKQGRIKSYGVSSNTFAYPSHAPDATDLTQVNLQARGDSRGSGFKWIQFPFNLLETSAALKPQHNGKTLLQTAQELGLKVLINRPLNAFLGNQLIRLADQNEDQSKNQSKDQSEDQVLNGFKKSLENTLELESQYAGEKWIHPESILWGEFLQNQLSRISDLDTWSRVLSYRILPTLGSSLEVLENELSTRSWAHLYLKQIQDLFEAFTNWLKFKAEQKNKTITRELLRLCPDLGIFPTLSQKVLTLYLSIPGIDTVLLGMRQKKYVQEALDIKKLDSKTALKVLEEFRYEFKLHS